MNVRILATLLFLSSACNDYSKDQFVNAPAGILGGTLDTEHTAAGALTVHPSGAVLCSATLIGPRHVLTAAHCVAGRDSGSLRFFIGDSVMNNDGRRVRIASFTVHPEYAADLLVFDAAVLELAEAVDDVTPATLGTGRIDGDMILFSGFGRIDDGSSGTRYRAEVSLLSTYPSMLSTVYTEALETGICFADSGAPALYETAQSFEVIGVVSGVLAYDSTMAPCIGTYNVTRIGPLLPFIAGVTGGSIPDCHDNLDVCVCQDACQETGQCDNSRCAEYNCAEGFNCLAECPAFDGACFNDCYVATTACELPALYRFIDCGSRYCGSEPAASVSDCLKENCDDALTGCFYSSGCDSDSSASGGDTDSSVDSTSATSSDGADMGSDTSSSFPSPHAVSGCRFVGGAGAKRASFFVLRMLLH